MDDTEGFGPVTVITADGSEPGFLMPDDSIKVAPRDDYEARGIFPDTFACICAGVREDMESYLFRLIAAGLEAKVAIAPDGLWHVAIRGGLKSSPLAWLLTLRDDIEKPVECHSTLSGQHPLLSDPPLGGIEQYQDEDR